MTGGLIQLVAYGAQNIYLTGNPQITFFKVVYKRHTNFSIESIEQTLDGTGNFGGAISTNLSRKGDLISKCWLQVELPPAATIINAADSTYKNWVDNVGHALVKDSEISIGGQLVDRQQSEWLDIWNELTDPNKLSWKLLGKREFNSKENQTYKSRYYIPLQFWFTRNIGLALPLIALQYHEVNIKINLRELKSLIQTDSSSFTLNGKINQLSLYVDYIYLDTDERRRFSQTSHEYLIEQTQIAGSQSLVDGNNTYDINLNHPVKEIVWVIRDTNRGKTTPLPKINESNTDTFGNDWFNYSASSRNDKLGYGTFDSFSTAKLTLNGQDRFSERDAIYFRQVQPHQHHSNVPKKHIYVYSFALKPEQHQPTGTCNFSRIDNAKLLLNGVKAGELMMFATNYNILRIMSGMGGLAYSN